MQLVMKMVEWQQGIRSDSERESGLFKVWWDLCVCVMRLNLGLRGTVGLSKSEKYMLFIFFFYSNQNIVYRWAFLFSSSRASCWISSSRSLRNCLRTGSSCGVSGCHTILSAKSR